MIGNFIASCHDWFMEGQSNIIYVSTVLKQEFYLGTLLLIWVNFNTGMDK